MILFTTTKTSERGAHDMEKIPWKFSKNMLNFRKKNIQRETPQIWERKSNETEILGKEPTKFLVYNTRLSPFQKILGNASKLGIFKLYYEKLRYELRKLSSNNICGISEGKDSLDLRTKIFRKYLISYFRLNALLLGNLTISGFSGKFPWKFPYHLSPFRNCRNFLYWMESVLETMQQFIS